MEDRRERHFLYLDGMRGIAAIFVALMHAGQIFTHEKFQLVNAHLAVDFFFCLSGFVVAYAYADKLAGGMSRQDFLRRRFIRLAPLLLFGLLLGASVTIISAIFSAGPQDMIAAEIESLFSFLMLPAGFIFGNVAYPTNNPVWSLFFEIAASIAFGFITVSRRYIAGALTIALAALLALTAWHFHSILFLGFAHPNFFLGGFVRVAFPFAAGTMICRLGWFRDRRLIWSWMAFLAVPLLLGLPVGTWKSDVLVIVFVIPLLVVGGTAYASDVVAPYLKFLGELSYPLYVIHEPIFRGLGKVSQVAKLSALYPLPVVTATVIFAAGISIVVSRLYDIPIRGYLEARYKREKMNKVNRFESHHNFGDSGILKPPVSSGPQFHFSAVSDHHAPD